MLDYGNWANRLQARKDRWGLMKEFCQEWDLPIDGAEAIPSSILTSAEQRLDCPMPLAFKEWCQLPFNTFFLKPRLFWTHLTEPEELEIWPPGAAKDGLIVFKTEYQGCAEWAFLVRDAHLDDPPVYVGDTVQINKGVEDWQLQSQSFSEFMLQLLLVRMVHFDGRFHACVEEASGDLLAKANACFPDAGFPVWLEYGDECRLHAGADTFVLSNCHTPFGGRQDLCLNSLSRDGREMASKLLEIEWTCTSDNPPD